MSYYTLKHADIWFFCLYGLILEDKTVAHIPETQCTTLSSKDESGINRCFCCQTVSSLSASLISPSCDVYVSLSGLFLCDSRSSRSAIIGAFARHATARMAFRFSVNSWSWLALGRFRWEYTRNARNAFVHSSSVSWLLLLLLLTTEFATATAFAVLLFAFAVLRLFWDEFTSLDHKRPNNLGEMPSSFL